MAKARYRNRLTAERLRQLLHYDPATGEFTWIRVAPSTHNVKVGDRAGCLQHGYVRVRIDGNLIYAHCLAWLWMTGNWPADQIDHRNGNRCDNRWENLREATARLNSQNRRFAPKRTSSGFLGVRPRRGGFEARICTGGHSKHLGDFRTAEAAHCAYVQAKRALHPGGTL